MELAIVVWSVGALFTAGYMTAVTHGTNFPTWKVALLIVGCLTMWPAFIGVTVGMID